MKPYEEGVIRVDLKDARFKDLFLEEFFTRNPLCGPGSSVGTICYIMVPGGEELEYTEKAKAFVELVESAELLWAPIEV